MYQLTEKIAIPKHQGVIGFNLNMFKAFSLNLKSFYSTGLLNKLDSAQVAFAHRLGIQNLSSEKVLSVLRHPKIQSEPKSSDEFDQLVVSGDRALTFFSKEYLKTRFPEMHSKYLSLGVKVLTADKNVLELARLSGIDAACGLDALIRKKFYASKFLQVKQYRKQSLAALKQVEGVDFKEIQLSCFKALLGLIGAEVGPVALRTFLDTRYFNNSAFNPQHLIRPLYPIPDLAQLYPNMVFRLHQESGRLSSSSMFVVGVYADSIAQECLGEGFGASQALAQHRAATDALRKLFLVEKRVLARPSDNFQSFSQVIERIEE